MIASVQDPVSGASGTGLPVPGASTSGSAAAPLLDSVVRGVHDSVDRVAARVAPALDQLVGGAQDASQAVRQRAHDVGELGQEWTETLRATVRDHPLACLAAALAVGVLVSRLAQGDRR
jgi:hypothetical protein